MTCKTDGCDAKAVARGMCKSCYGKWRAANPDAVRPTKRWNEAPAPCAVDECLEPVVAKKKCRAHYYKAQRAERGAVPVEASVTGQDEYVENIKTVRTARGWAFRFRCTDCRKSAGQWALVPGKQEHFAYVQGSAVPYSTDPQNFQPMCVPCQRKLYEPLGWGVVSL